MLNKSLELDHKRLLGRLDAMAESAKSAQGSGVTRLAWSDRDVAARKLLACWALEAGLKCKLDPFANLTVQWEGSEAGLAPIVIGSHLDTVIDAGALDGAYGTVAAFEIVATLARSSRRLRHPLRAVAWANEEGVVAPPFTGSLGVIGAPIDLEAPGPDGIDLSERLRRGGGDPLRLSEGRWEPISAYLELHIEQGPVLENRGVRIGVVTGIIGSRRGVITVRGYANHAGTTPMHMRRDALLAAIKVVQTIDGLAMDGPVDVATTGSFWVYPGNANVVAGRVVLSYDLRSLDDHSLDEALQLLEDRVVDIAKQSGTTIELVNNTSIKPAKTDPKLQEVVANAAEKLGLETLRLPSGAGHDAQNMAVVAPMAMIFVPSAGGISHNAQESTPPEQLIDGARTLAEALLMADVSLDD